MCIYIYIIYLVELLLLLLLARLHTPLNVGTNSRVVEMLVVWISLHDQTVQQCKYFSVSNTLHAPTCTTTRATKKI